MTRQIPRFKRQVEELTKIPSGLYRAKLSEEYDGIGQYVLVALSRGTIGSAYKARVASGDFGGRRTFPEGTPVIVHSIRGRLEVFLGNHPGCDEVKSKCKDTFGRTETGQWGESEIAGIPWENWPEYDPAEHISADGEYGVINNYPGLLTESNDFPQWIKSSEPVAYPLELTYRWKIEQSPWPPTLNSQEPFLYMGICEEFEFLQAVAIAFFAGVYLGYEATAAPLGLEIQPNDDRINSAVDEPRQDYLLPGVPADGTITRLKLRITDPDNLDDAGCWGVYGKAWTEEDSEPGDWQFWHKVQGANQPTIPVDPIYDSVFFASSSVGDVGGHSRTLLDQVTLCGWCPVP